jgi:hypothetical protein
MRRTPAPGDYEGWVAQLGRAQRRQEAKRHLTLSGPPAVPAIRHGMSHPNPVVRRCCADLLDRLLDESALPDLIAALDDVDADVCKRALHALACDQCKEGECRPGEDLWVPKALDLLHDPRADVRAGAIDALGKVVRRRPDVVAALEVVAGSDPDRGLRGMARGRSQGLHV